MRAFTIWLLQREQKRACRRYAEWIKAAKDRDDENLITLDAMDERDRIRDKIWHLRSLQLQDEAERLGIPIPALNAMEHWEPGLAPNTIRLTLKAQSDLRQAIRSEKRDKWSVFTFVVKEIAVPIIGVIGGIMGLISLVHSLHLK